MKASSDLRLLLAANLSFVVMVFILGTFDYVPEHEDPELKLFAPTSAQQVVHRRTALLACRAYAFCSCQMF
jgi:hypothetical protein